MSRILPFPSPKKALVGDYGGLRDDPRVRRIAELLACMDEEARDDLLRALHAAAMKHRNANTAIEQQRCKSNE
jgi:hypothetical protein